MFTYSLSKSWTRENAKKEGVFLAYEILDRELPSNRSPKLKTLKEHYSIPLEIVTIQDIETYTNKPPAAGEHIHFRESLRKHWYFLVFHDGRSALAAGPVNPSLPYGAMPIGIIITIIGLPILTVLLVLRIEPQLTKVEQASLAFAQGDLSARVDNKHGPSKELAISFNEMAERIEQLIKSRDELVQAVSHELGSPLSRLRFHIELLENQIDDKNLERLNAMTNELDALDELVSELLGYVQSADLELNQHRFNPEQILRDLLELTQLEASPDRAMHVGLEINNPSEVFADKKLFQRAVENILRNAFRHATSKVQVQLKRENEFVCVAIHDDGPGIPLEIRDKVMAPFFRQEPDRSRKAGGMGLGLAIVNRIIQRHGGKLTIGDSPLGGVLVETFWPIESDSTAN